MSGTSADGIDAALVEIHESEGPYPAIRLVSFLSEPFSAEDRLRIFELFDPDVSMLDAGVMHIKLGRQFGAAARKLLEQAHVLPEDVRVVGSHGQTVAYYPSGTAASPGTPFTIQLGDPHSIAEACGIPVVSDFRSHDLVLGGVGAPLVPYFDHAVLSSPTETRVLLNIGGIANVTILPAGQGVEHVIGFDTGPGNMILDAAAAALSSGERRIDENGAWAARGVVHEGLLASWKSHRFFSQSPPKATGREDFGVAYTWARLAEAQELGLAAADVMATLTALVADTIANAIRSHAPEPVALIVGGGGVHNQTIMGRLGCALDVVRPWERSDAYGVPADAKEAMAFAYLAWQFVSRRVTNVPAATGARAQVPLGSWTPAANRGATDAPPGGDH